MIRPARFLWVAAWVLGGAAALPSAAFAQGSPPGAPSAAQWSSPPPYGSFPPPAAASPAPSPDRAPAEARPEHKTFGMAVDVGLPDGLALAFVVRPEVEWLRLSAAFTYNTMAPGIRGGMTVDPFPFFVAPTFTSEVGYAWGGPLPGVTNSPAVSYTYANFHAGLEIGHRSSVRFYLRGGVSWLDASATAPSTGVEGVSLGQPSYRGWVAPSGKVGFTMYF